MSQQPINIIGAGLSGLVLGRSLLKRGVPVILHDRAPSTPRHSYGITLHPQTYQPLLKLLDLDELTFKQRVSIDGKSGSTNASKLACPATITPTSFRAHRQRLEKLLSANLDIRWNTGIQNLETSATSNTLILSSGTNITTSQPIIAADGPHSSIRKTLFPHAAEPRVLPYVVFNGKRRVPKPIFEAIYAPSMQDSAVIETHQNGALLQISINDTLAEEISISWVYSRKAMGKGDKCFTPNRDTNSATDIPSEFYEEVGRLQGLEQPFKEAFDTEKVRSDRVLTWLMRTTEVPLSQLLEGVGKGVCFVGDAVHAQAILGGEGANVAILDGLGLAERIAEDGVGGVREWYTKRFQVWQESLEKSKKTIEDMHVDRKSLL